MGKKISKQVKVYRTKLMCPTHDWVELDCTDSLMCLPPKYVYRCPHNLCTHSEVSSTRYPLLEYEETDEP